MTPQERIDWLVKYAASEPCNALDILNTALVDAYAKATGSKLVIKLYGANYCPQLSRDLKAAMEQGLCRRLRVGISGMPTGFPTWVWSYDFSGPG